MKKITYLVISVFVMGSSPIFSQNAPAKEKENLKYSLNESGSHFFQITFLNQFWARVNQNNPGTLVQNTAENVTADLGLRRTRIQMFGQISDKVFLYFQFGQNNFNSQFNLGGNRKTAPFFHDALCEYNVSKANQLKLGGGLTIANGLSRFSQPAIGSIMTLDVPVFAQATVDQTDQFSRKLSMYARGQIGKFDYRLVLSDPFPVSSSGNIPPLSKFSNFSTVQHHFQQQGLLIYQFFEHEQHLTPYMPGTYLGKKKVFNISVGGIFQKNAVWNGQPNASGGTDTAFQNMKLWSAESFLDMPLNKEKGTAISAYAGYFNTNYGLNYLRYNGIMNVASGTSLTASNSLVGQGPTYGNAYPMFGTGSQIYTQIGYLMKNDLLKNGAKLLPYVSGTFAKVDRLEGKNMNVFHAGINYLISGHQSKITLDFENRPTYKIDQGTIQNGVRKNGITLQYQIFF